MRGIVANFMLVFGVWAAAQALDLAGGDRLMFSLGLYVALIGAVVLGRMGDHRLAWFQQEAEDG